MASTPSMKQVADGSVRRSMRWGGEVAEPVPCQMCERVGEDAEADEE